MPSCARKNESSDLSINLALILTALTLLTGIVVALDKFVWGRSEGERAGGDMRDTLVE